MVNRQAKAETGAVSPFEVSEGSQFLRRRERRLRHALCLAQEAFDHFRFQTGPDRDPVAANTGNRKMTRSFCIGQKRMSFLSIFQFGNAPL